MHLPQMGNLAFEHSGRLRALGLHEPGAHLLVETLEGGRDLASLLLVECSLQVPDHYQRMIDAARSSLDVAIAERVERSPQIFHRLLIQQHYQSYRACPSHRRFAIRQSRIHTRLEFESSDFPGHRPEVSVGVDEPLFELFMSIVARV